MFDASARNEVALRRSSRCPRDRYVHVNPGIEPGVVLAPLLYLDRIQSGRTRARFACVDRTKSRFCDTPESLLRTLAGLVPRVVTREKNVIKFWLYRSQWQGGDAVVELRYPAGDPAKISVERRIPAPA